MQDQHEARRIPLGVVAGISAAVLAAGGGAAWWGWTSLHSSETPETTEVPRVSQSPETALQPTEDTVQVYWLNATNTEIEFAPSPISLNKATEEPSEILKTAFNQLLAGPTDPENTTAIPEETKLLNLSKEAGGIYVDLSQDFTSGGGSASMTGRLGQVVYTATSLDPNAQVWISVEGEPLEVLGGEGLVVDQPMTRKTFDENFAF